MTPEEIFASVIWKCIPSDEDAAWVSRVAKPTISKSPLGDYGAIVQEMLNKGISAESIARFAKIVGYETAFDICYALEDPDFNIEGLDEADKFTWRLFRTDNETNEPIEPISSCYELLLSTDPSGNEMNPPKVSFAKVSDGHHAAHISSQSKFRARWLTYYSKAHFRSVEISAELLSFPIEPMWPGRHVGLLLATTDTETWIMSDGLSNIEHPDDNANWDRVVPSYSPEIISRVPVSSVNFQNTEVELAQNPHVQLFLKLACLCLQLNTECKFRDKNHIVAPFDDESNTSVDSRFVLFSNAESLSLAEPIQLPDHDYLRVQVLFATVVDHADTVSIEADATLFSQALDESGRLGALTY